MKKARPSSTLQPPTPRRPWQREQTWQTPTGHCLKHLCGCSMLDDAAFPTINLQAETMWADI